MAASSMTMSEKAKAQGARRNRSRTARRENRAEIRPFDGVAHLEEGQERDDDRQQQGADESQGRNLAARRDQDRRNDQPGERAEEPHESEPEIIREPERGQEIPEAVAKLGVQSPFAESADQPERVAERPEEMSESSAAGAGDQDMAERQHGHEDEDDSPDQGRPTRPGRSTSADWATEPTSHAGTIAS